MPSFRRPIFARRGLQRLRAVFQRLGQGLEYLTRPASDITNPEWRVQARLTAASLLVWLVGAVLEVLWWMVADQSPGIGHLAYLVPLLVGLYLLSRTRFYWWAALGSILGLAALPQVLLYAAWQRPDMALTLMTVPARYLLVARLIWLMFPMLMAALLLPRGWDLLGVLAIAHSIWWIPRGLHVAPTEVILLYTLLLGLGLPLWVMALVQKTRRRQLVRLQEELREQRDFLNTIIDSIDASFYVIDAQTYEIILANSKARALGIDRYNTCYALTHRRTTPCDGAEHPCPLVHVRTHREPFVVEHIHYKPDGTPYYVEVHGYPVLDEKGEVRFMVEYSLDITRRKEAEAELRKLWRAIEHSAHGVVITDANGVIEYVNPAFTKTTGYTAEEAIGKTPRLLRSGYHSEAFYRDLWETIKAGKIWHGEFVNRRKDGSLYYEEQTIAPVPDEHGNITHFIAVKQDVTERKRLMRELKEAKNQAEQALAFKSALLAAISHDLRTPLGAIVGYADMLRQEVFGPLNGEQKERLEAILSSAHYMRELIAMLLLHAEMESDTLQVRRQPVPLRKLLLTVREGLWVLAQKRQLQLEVDMSPDAPQEVYTDPRLLRSIITNLVSNALKFTKEGGVTIRVYRVDEGHWALAVADTGVGMGEEERRRIFDPFYTRSRVKMAGAPGLGLGLYIVRSLVERLGGTIEVWSEEGKGSVFTIVFPHMPVPQARDGALKQGAAGAAEEVTRV